jgi:SAM-dependent methyltransferase
MAAYDYYLNPVCRPSTLDTCLSRQAILESLRCQLPSLEGTLLDIGCGQMGYKPVILAPPSRVRKYIGLDLRDELRDERYRRFVPDLEWDGSRIPLEAEVIDCVMATEVFAQCQNVETLMCEAARVLKAEGTFFFTVPFWWPLHDSPCDQYRYTPFALERHLINAGFDSIKMHSMGGWDASLAQMIGLWVRRRPMSSRKRRILSWLAFPVVRTLACWDSPPPVFTDQTMITLIAGSASKAAMGSSLAETGATKH